MLNRQDTFNGAGGLTLFRQSWIPSQPARTVFVIVHGAGDHSGRYGNLVNYLVSENCVVHAYDQRGHGRSPGQRGGIDSWQEFRDDLGIFLELIRKEESGLPIFLFGQSMGGVIVLEYCLQKKPDLAGVICCAPAIGKLGISPLLWKIGMLVEHFFPHISFNTGLDIERLSRYPEIADAALRDRLFHRKATPRLARELAERVKWIHDQAGNFSLPLLIMHGTEDRIADIEGSRRFVASADKTLVSLLEFAGGYHELYNDLCRDDLFSAIRNWQKQIQEE